MRLLIVFLLVSLLSPLCRAATDASKVPVAPPVSKSVAIVELEALTVLGLSQTDGRAVLGLPDKQMVLVKKGDPVPRTRAVLTEVLADKLVLDEKSADGKTRQLVWMRKGQGATPGRIERFATEAAPTVIVPPPQRAVTTLTRSSAAGKP